MIKREDLPEVRGKYRFDADLSKMCWFRVGGKADVLFIPRDTEDLIHFLSHKDPAMQVFIIGVGSNILIPDCGIRGVVIRLGQDFNYITHGNLVITAGAATLDLNIALYAMEHSIGGLEFLSGIPGTIGGALAMNAGSYGRDISNILIQATAVNVESCQIEHFTNEEIGYKYRGKAISDNWVFLEAKFQGFYKERQIIEHEIHSIQDSRIATQPIKSKTCGSTFKNPDGLRAWELIQKAGLMGFQVGGAQVSSKHCNFIINNGDATAEDILKLIAHIKKAVYEQSGVMLEEEVKIYKAN